MQVFATEVDDGVANVTINIYDEDHKFDLWKDGNNALVEYQETLSFRGQIRVSEPPEEVFKELMVSEEVTELLDKWGVSGVRRAEPVP
jgi:hypothetical protein